MRIWHLLSNRWNSAVTEYAISSARALAGRGHETLLTPLRGSPAEQRANDLGISTRAMDNFSAFKVVEARSIYRDFEPDLIFCHGGPECFLARYLEAPTIRVRGVDFVENQFLVTLRQRWAHSRIAAVLTPNEILAKKIQLVLPCLPVRAIVLGCDVEKFERVPNAREKTISAMIFGRFDPVKGHASFLKIWRMVVEQLPDAVLHIVGEPANVSLAQLEQQVREAGLDLNRHVKITATRVSDVAQCLSSASVGIVPSLGSEIIGRVTQEFLLCGTPVLVSGVGGLGELIFSPHAGANWVDMRPSEIADLVLKWLKRGAAESEEDRAARAACARELYSLAVMGEALQAVIDKAIR